MVVVNILAPICVLIGLGTILRASGFATEDFFRQTNRLVYWVGLPCLLFQKTATAVPQLSAAFNVLAVLLAGMVACILAGYLVAFALRLSRPAAASFVQGAYRGNLAYVGLPVVLYALAATGQNTTSTETIALLAIAPLIPVYNIVAVTILVRARPQEHPGALRQAARLLVGVITNPLAVACLAGVAFAYTGLGLPLVVDRSLAVIGQMALPLALLGIGASLRVWAVREGGVVAALASVLKVGLAPVVGFLVARAIGLSGPQLQMALLYLTMPTAVMSYVMAERMGADGRLAGSIVVLSTLLAMPALAVVLLLTQ